MASSLIKGQEKLKNVIWFLLEVPNKSSYYKNYKLLMEESIFFFFFTPSQPFGVGLSFVLPG